MIYLDSAATSLIKPPCVERAVTDAMRTMASPGRGGHKPAMLAAETVLDCRIAAAELFNVPEPERVVFTMNATHALNIAIASLVKHGDSVAVSGFEHNSVTRPLEAIGAEIRICGRELFNAQSVLSELERNIDGCSAAVFTHVSNAFGFILPIYGIADICRRHGVPLIVDASQSAGVLDVDLKRLGAAFIAMPGHKSLLGPRGTGLLLCSAQTKPLLHGGSGSDSILQHMPDYLPDMLEAGTHNVCGIAGLLAGIRFIGDRGTDNIRRREELLLDELKERLSGVEGLELFTGHSDDQCGVLSLRTRIDCESFAQALSERGICVRSGLHCAPLAHQSAQTIETGTVRLSLSPFLTTGQLRSAVKEIREILER